MIIFWYLTRRFLSFFVAVSLALALLFNFVEFFEKIVRLRSADTSVIAQFLGLSLIPNFFELLPIGVWLATCLLLKDLYQRHEWESLELLAYAPRRFFAFMFVMGLGLSMTTFVVYERWVSSLVFRAERFKLEYLKQASSQTIVSRWMELDNNQFCYFSVLDLKTLQGNDLLLVVLNKTFGLEKIIKSPRFTINTDNNTIHLGTAQVFDVEGQHEPVVASLKLESPAFFSSLRTNFETPTLSNSFKKILLYRSVLPFGVYNELMGQLCTRLAYYLQLLIYPVLTVSLFMLWSNPYIRWGAAFIAYPLFLLAGVIGQAAVEHGLPAELLLIPYLLIMLFVLGFWYRLSRRSS